MYLFLNESISEFELENYCYEQFIPVTGKQFLEGIMVNIQITYAIINYTHRVGQKQHLNRARRITASFTNQ